MLSYLCFTDAVKLWMPFSVFCAHYSIVAVQLTFSRNTRREQDSRGRSRGLVLRGNEKDRFRSSGDQKSQWNCMYCEDLACFLGCLIYYDKTPASKWIIEELRRKLPQDDVLCPQSGDTLWDLFLLCSPAGFCSISPRNSPGMGGTTKEKGVMRARGRIPHVMGHFCGSFQFSQQKDFVASWTCGFVHATSALWVKWTFNIIITWTRYAPPLPNLVAKLPRVSMDNHAPKDHGHHNILIYLLVLFHLKC